MLLINAPFFTQARKYSESPGVQVNTFWTADYNVVLSWSAGLWRRVDINLPAPFCELFEPIPRFGSCAAG